MALLCHHRLPTKLRQHIPSKLRTSTRCLAMYQPLFLCAMFALSISCARAFSKSTGSRYSVSRLLSMKGGAVPESEEMKPFYALGVNIAQQVGSELKTILSKEEVEVMLAGFSDAMTDKVVDDRELLMTYGKKLNEILESRSLADLDNQKKKGDDFLVKYLLSNVRAVKTPSGMLYNEMFAGIGEQATAQSTVMVHYHGTLIDGTVFDSSVDRGAPIKFPLRNVIKGWQEGVAMMRAGGKATLVIPSELAYGDKGSPPVIPAGATLVFEVELLEIVA